MQSSHAHDWLLFLGAGASAPPPTSLPTFPALSSAILESIGWRRSQDGKLWEHPSYPSFPQLAMFSEVLFGALNRFGVEFADALTGALHAARPNAIHDVAGRILAGGGLVWTTNVDDGVELACQPSPLRAGTASALAPSVLRPLTEATNGTLVKFHGTVDSPRTLAFTDRELLAPLDSEAVAHLTTLAHGRQVILYGYAGADADLFELLERVLAVARNIIWFEPSQEQRQEIQRSFPDARPSFQPSGPPDDPTLARLATARAFLHLASTVGLTPDIKLAEALTTAATTARLSLPEKHPSGITQARIVERFGDPGDDIKALSQARREDALHLRVGTLRGHLRWAVRQSLYGDGIVGKMVEWLTSHRQVLRQIRPRSLREYLITRGCALRLTNRDWRALDEFASWVVEQRNNPGDLYYRAQAGRYAMRVSTARSDADRAQADLSAVRDPERHAGAVLEQGCLAVYEGRFVQALRAAFELRRRTGRYAIPRWQSWGAWLEGVALCHLARPADARRAFDAGIVRFLAEGRPGPVADIRSGRLLAARVELAQHRSPTVEFNLEEAERLGGRHADDRRLIAADILLASNELDRASALLNAVAAHPANPIAEAWSNLGLAELARLEGHRSAPNAFQAITDFALDRGAGWLALQATIGMRMCGDPRATTIAARLPEQLQPSATNLRGIGEPRILWMTIL